MPEPIHTLVLGGSGFIGKPLLRQLGDDPGVRLSVLAHRQSLPELPSGTRVLHGNLASIDWAWLQKDPPHCVLHLARLAGRGRWGRSWAAWQGQRANRRLLRYLGALPQPPRMVYVSGSLMYGDRGEEWVDEETSLRPTSFARQYARAEQPLVDAAAQGGAVMLVRPGWVMGDGSWLRGFYFDRARLLGSVPHYGDGQNWMTVIHREDCAGLIRWVAARGTPGQAYNLGLQPPVRQAELVRAIGDGLQLPIATAPLAWGRRGSDPAPREAFAASIRLRTRDPKFFAGYRYRHPDPFSALAAALAEYRERILRTPMPACD